MPPPAQPRLIAFLVLVLVLVEQRLFRLEFQFRDEDAGHACVERGDGEPVHAISAYRRLRRVDRLGLSTFNDPTNDPDVLWSTTKGAGLSLARIRIDPGNGHTSEVNIAKTAVSYGVKVWATPWTPPAADKSNHNVVMGKLTDPSAFAAFLTDFVASMKGQGVDIYAISSQNEPDANVNYESCVYDGTTLAAFVGSYMAPAFACAPDRRVARSCQGQHRDATGDASSQVPRGSSAMDRAPSRLRIMHPGCDYASAPRCLVG